MNKNLKNELENKLIFKKAKYYRINKISNYVSKISIGVLLLESMIMMGNALGLNTVHMSFSAVFLSTIGVSLLSIHILDKKKDKIREEYLSVKEQLEDIVSMDFEKKRYELEKKHGVPTSSNALIKSIEEEKELLQKYKQDLNYYAIYNVDDELKNEINTRNYTLQKLNKLK